MRTCVTIAMVLMAGFVVIGCENEGDSLNTGQDTMAPAKGTSKAPAVETKSPATKAPPMDPSLGRIHEEFGGLGASVVVTKTAPKEVIVGQPFDYTLKVANTSSKTLEDVVLVAKVPAGMKVTSSAPQGDAGAGTMTWDLGTLKGGQSKTCVVTGTAKGVGAMTACSNVTFKLAQACLTIKAVKPALQITKTAPAMIDCPCDPIPYVITVTNTGSGPATNVKLVDTMPKGVSYQGNQKVSAALGTLAPGQSKVVKFNGKAATVGTYENVATATADHGLTATAKATTVVREPVLELTKTAPKMRFVGRGLTYKLTVKNTGTAPTQNTVLVDTLPRGVSFVSATGGGKYSAGKVSWALGSLKPGASESVSVSVKTQTIGTLLNQAVVTSRCAKDTAQATTEVKGIAALLLECVDSDDPVEVGATTTYTISVTNQGTAKDTNVTLVCTLPAEQALVSAKGVTEATTKGQVITFAPLGKLDARHKAVYKIIVKGVKPGDSRFKVSMTSDGLTEEVTETESTRIYNDDE